MEEDTTEENTTENLTHLKKVLVNPVQTVRVDQDLLVIKHQIILMHNMNNIPPPLTSQVLPPMTAPTGKYEPRPMIEHRLAAFGR